MKNGKIFKRITAFFLAFVMIAGVLPMFSITAAAETEPVLTVSDVSDNSYTYSSADVIASGDDAGPDASWVLYDTGELIISGTGDMSNWNDINTPWYNYQRDIETVVISENITSVGEWAFIDCYNITSVEMPGVTRIEQVAFNGCTNLTSIYMPSVTNIGSMAFNICMNLTSVNMPKVTNIGSMAFRNCTSLYDVYFGLETPPVVETDAFQNIAPGARAIVPPDGTWPAEGTVWNGLVIVYAAASEGTITVSGGTSWIGGEIPVEVTLTDNPGISTYKLVIDYNANVLEYIGGTDTAAVGAGGILPVNQINPSEGRIIVTAYDTADVYTDGLLFTLRFKVKNGAAAGESALTLSYFYEPPGGDIKNTDNTPFSPHSVDGSITVITILYGNINGDGYVDMGDLVALARHIADIDVINAPALLEAADVTGDGRVNIADLIRLARYLAEIDISPLGK